MTCLTFALLIKAVRVHRSDVHKNVDIYKVQRSNQNVKAMQANKL